MSRYISSKNSSILYTDQYSLPTNIGGSGAILAVPSSGSELEWIEGGATGDNFIVPTDNLVIPNTLIPNATAAARNVIISPGSNYALTTGDDCLAIGWNNMIANTSGGSLVSIGNQSLINNIDGSSNIGIGHNSLYSNVSGSVSVAVGSASGQYSTGSGNCYYGVSSGGSAADANFVTSIGYQSSVSTSAYNQTSLGYGSTNTVDNSCQIGNSSVNLLKLGSKNVVDFSRAASSTLIGCSTSTINPMTGDANLIINLINNTNFNRYGISGNNTYLGNSCGRGQSATNHTGSSNTAVGGSALNNVTSCVSCSAFGTSSLTNLVGGSYVIGIGANSGASNSNGSGDIYIGVTTASSASVSNEIVIAGGTSATTGAGANTITLGNTSCLSISPSDTAICSLGSSTRPFSELFLNGTNTAIASVANVVAMGSKNCALVKLVSTAAAATYEDFTINTTNIKSGNSLVFLQWYHFDLAGAVPDLTFTYSDITDITSFKIRISANSGALNSGDAYYLSVLIIQAGA